MKAILLKDSNVDKIINEAKTAIDPEELRMMIDEYDGKTELYFIPWFETAGSGSAYSWGTVPAASFHEHFNGTPKADDFFEITHK